MSAKLGISLAALLSVAACCEEGDMQCQAEQKERHEQKAAERQERDTILAEAATQYESINSSRRNQSGSFEFTLLDRNTILADDNITAMSLNYASEVVSSFSASGTGILSFSLISEAFVQNTRIQACEIADTIIENLSPESTKGWQDKNSEYVYADQMYKVRRLYQRNNNNMPKEAAAALHNEATAFDEMHCKDIAPN